MRLAHTLAFLTLTASTAWAQSPSLAAPAADPSAATPPLRHQPLPASGGVETAPTDWRSAHEAVAAFPRGHADIAAWEATHAAALATPVAPPAAPPASAPAHGHMPFGMHHHAPARPPEGQP